MFSNLTFEVQWNSPITISAMTTVCLAFLLRALEFGYIDFGYIVTLPIATLFFRSPQNLLFVYDDCCEFSPHFEV